MSRLSGLLGWVPKEERRGIQLDVHAPQWEVCSPKEFPAFLRALVDLVPHGAMAYLEGGSPPEHLESFLKERGVPEVSRVAMGTIWPRPRVYHLPATPDNLRELADIAEHCAEPEVAIHFHIYKDGKVLLQWFDAFADPMFISKEIPEDRVRAFCGRLGIEYSTFTGGLEDAPPDG